MGFYDFDDYQALIEAAGTPGTTTHLIVLLGGEAGCVARRRQRGDDVTP